MSTLSIQPLTQAVRGEIVWAPHPGSQVLFLSCPVYECLLEGTRGGGKTDALLIDFAQHVGRGFGAAWRGILFRQTYPQLADVVAKSKKLFYRIFPGAKFNASDYTWTFPDGEQLLLRHMKSPDDYWNYHGHEYPWIAFEELTNWPTAECYESMFACSRSSHPGMPRKYRATCNPYGRGHTWVKARFIDPAPAGKVIRESGKPDRVRIHSSLSENTHLLAADPEYIAKLRAISDPNKRKAWLFGSWEITSGGMFDDLWKPEAHIVPVFGIPAGWRIDRALDWGSSRPFSVGWWAQSDGSPITIAGKQRTFPRGTLARVAEWYGCTGKPNEGLRMTAGKVGEGIKERQVAFGFGARVKPGPADSSIFDTTDEASIADNMAKVGVTWEAADKRAGSRKNGWELMRERLENSLHDNGKPGLIVFDRCRDFIRLVPSTSRDEDDPEDIDTDAEDHIHDEARYRVLAAPRIARTQALPI